SAGTLSVLCPWSGGASGRAALYRAQRRARDDRVHASYPSAIPPLDGAPGNRARAAARRTVGVRLEAAGAATINSGIFGVAIIANAIVGAELHLRAVTFHLSD